MVEVILGGDSERDEEVEKRFQKNMKKLIKDKRRRKTWKKLGHSQSG
jgi:hypothetical protein